MHRNAPLDKYRLFPAKIASRFAAGTSGNVATLFALAAVPLMGVAGSAVDYGNSLRVKASLQNALDAGVMAGATAMVQGASKADSEAAVAKFVSIKFTNPDGTSPTVTANADSAVSKVTASAIIDVPTTFMRIFGTPTMSVNVTSEALYGSALTSGGTAEVVIAIDTTGSMAGAKLDGAKAAATNLVNQLIPPAAAPSTTIKIGLVPFNNYVNIGASYRGAAWLTNTNNYSDPPVPQSCYTSYPNPVFGPWYTATQTQYNDGVPYTATWEQHDLIDWGPPGPEVCPGPNVNQYLWNGVVASRGEPLDYQDTVSAVNPVPGVYNAWYPPAELVRLTNNPAVVNAQIGAMTASGETYIAPGLLWAWRLLSPNGPFADGAAYGKPKNKKYLILMTDGANTKSPSNYYGDVSKPNHEGGDSAAANTTLTKTCQAIAASASEIEVYTIAFNVTDTNIKNLLQGCVKVGNYFDATSIADMTAAFSQIGQQVAINTGVRLSK